MHSNFSCFKAYDIRGQYPSDINCTLAYAIAIGYAKITSVKQVVIGYDSRLESPAIAAYIEQALHSLNITVINIGLCGTEEIYYHTMRLSAAETGGIMITASHNPKNWVGIKLVGKEATPIAENSGLSQIKDYIQSHNLLSLAPPEPADLKPYYQQRYVNIELKQLYADYLRKYISPAASKPLKIVVNAGNGTAGLLIKQLEPAIAFELIYLQAEPDGNFPNGVPNPLLPAKRAATVQAIQRHKADLGLAWDGDFDRCFFFDHQGNFVPGYYIVGLLASICLQQCPGEKIVHDTRLVWNSQAIAAHYGGQAITSPAGHSFIKQAMRQHQALYGGEISAHHYFREFGYCDSGMIPWLLITQLISSANTSLAQLVNNMQANYPCSEEINYTLKQDIDIFSLILKHYQAIAIAIDQQDGLAMEFTDWRFSLRKSNTEPLYRLNVEVRKDKNLLQTKILELEKLIHYSELD